MPRQPGRGAQEKHLRAGGDPSQLPSTRKPSGQSTWNHSTYFGFHSGWDGKPVEGEDTPGFGEGNQERELQTNHLRDREWRRDPCDGSEEGQSQEDKLLCQ